MGLMKQCGNVCILYYGGAFYFLLSMTIGGLVGGADIVGHLLGRVNRPQL